jgi:Lantibiotic dehydratase, N terminus/Coenzyme PQQ synthesis protein D (PqqD)
MAETSAAPLPDHLAPLHGDRWGVWRWAALRSAGFPVDRVLALASPECAAAADRCLDAGDEAEQAFGESFDAALDAATRGLRQVALDGAFREAVTWQNRAALRTGVDVLLQRPPGLDARPSKHRQKEALVTSYLQRYCAKNDTIGFFGPVGWARVDAGGPPLDVRPGASLLAERTTYFEGWCIDTLAETLARDGGLLPWLAPRRMPHVHLEGDLLHVPLAAPVRMDPVAAAVLRACDGERTARDVAAELLADPDLPLTAEAEVFEVLARLRTARRIEWTLEVPGEGLHPEASLRRLLARAGDGGRRRAALAALDELERARDAVAGAAGDAGRLDAAMDSLDGAFVRLTGAAATRRAGQTYAGRALVYEDARRDVDVRIGPGLVSALGPPLALVLDAAGWLASEAATLYREAFAGILDELGPGPVPFTSFWMYAHELLFADGGAVIERLVRRLDERWAGVLALAPGARRVDLAVADLRPRVAAAFAVAHPRWPAALHHSPDLMVAAKSVQDVREGRCTFVLGEVHPAGNTLRSRFFAAQHPAPEELVRAVERDLPGPAVVPVYGRASSGMTLRMGRGLVSPRDHRLVFAADTCGTPPERTLTTGALVVERAGDSLAVRTRDGRLRFDVLDVLGDLLAIRVQHAFRVVPPAEHTPRVAFDRLVVCREAWRFDPADLPFASVPSERARFLAVRRWKRAHDLPRFVFVRARSGTKPFFVDLDSPLSIDVLARAVRREDGGAITVSEMLPTPDQLWLADAEGRRYTSELRMVAVEREVTA